MTALKHDYDRAMNQLTAAGAPYEIAGDAGSGFHYVNAPATLIEALAAGRQHGDREFLVYEGERYSFEDLAVQADAIAAALQHQGIAPGDRVAIAMRNYPEWMAAYTGIVNAGAVVVPVNSWGRPADIAFAVVDSGARFVFCDQQRYDGIAGILAEHAVGAVIARPDDPEDVRSMRVFLSDHAGAGPVPADVSADDLAMIMYTSGTSGKPKGAASTHRALGQAIVNMECAAAAAVLTNEDLIGTMLEKGFEPTSLLAVPLFHVSGLHAQFFGSYRGGRRIVMMYKWDVDRALDYIERERITTVAAAPTMMLDLLESPRFAATDTSSLFSLGIGGAATPPRVQQLIREHLPTNFSGTGYGMTETNAQGASMTGRVFHEKPGCAGFPHPIVQLRICDEEGRELPRGETGEIWVRSPTNIREYWHRPEANAQDFRDGWLRTGDIGRLDEDGLLYLADRATDMIIRGGENIYPVEIENELLEHPAVKEVAALGLPHERWGDEVAAVVYLHPGQALSEEALRVFSSERLAGYKVPAHIVFRDRPLPRNASSKILKRELREELLLGGCRTQD